MIVGDKCVLLPTKKRRRFVQIVGLHPVINAPMAEIRPLRTNGRRRWVALRDLQGMEAPKP